MHWSPLHTSQYHSTAWRRSRENDKTGSGALSLQFRQHPKSPGGEIMPSCVACGAELEPPVPHPTPSTSRACTASPARTTAATTSSGPRRPPASSPRSGPAAVRQWPCLRSEPCGTCPTPRLWADVRHQPAPALGHVGRPGYQERGDQVLAGTGTSDWSDYRHPRRQPGFPIEQELQARLREG